MEIEMRNPASLLAYENNARTHSDEQIEELVNSIKHFGFNDPIEIGEDGTIISGHARALAAIRAGLSTVPVVTLQGMDENARKAYILAANRIAQNAGWDAGLLKIEFENLLEIEKLLNKSKIDLIFTDPPYNVNFNGRSGKFDVIKNDNLESEEFKKFITDICAVIITFNVPYYVWCNWKFYGLLQENLDFTACIVWAKNNFGMGKGYRHQHEFCLTNAKVDEDIKNESDLWNVDKDTNYEHPTQKPVELACRALQNHKKFKNILDLFGGSGSTLIACEKLGKTGFIHELDPIYVDLIVARWERFTGEKAILESTGEKFHV